MGRRAPVTRALIVLAGCVALASCAGSSKPEVSVKESQTQRQSLYKVGKPYQIAGVWYYPQEDYSYDETGVASWYGPDFHGKFTANGEVFDQNEVTAAHRTLPMPCFVRVTNLDNGRSLVIRVNDRGPFAHGRILDVSRRAAQLLGMELNGTARVRVQIMAEESMALAMQLKAQQNEVTLVTAAPRESVQAQTLAPPPGAHESRSRAPVTPKLASSAPPPEAAPVAALDQPHLENQTVKVEPVKATQLYIQAGAFSRADNAHRLSAALSPIGQATITQVRTANGTFFRVRLGPITKVEEADALLEKVIGSGYPDAKLVVD